MNLNTVHIGFIIGLGSMWLLSDGIYSWTLYHNAVSYENERKQTFWKDHWVRTVRIIISVGFICLAWFLIGG